MEPGLEETEGGGEKEGWMMTLSPGVVGAVWMALDHVLFKHTWWMHSLESSQKETGWGTLGCLSQHHHTAAPRNPSSKRGTASLSTLL